eukprot:TRINITY_DN8229_c0_g1_i3.p1 TRINITY_DN8229_c0_g1~~TRINITY_DN8229_c0_g1_i3.p1  ORF type:complete len:487 (+),score=91.25 TRINITY_DN8229_c0_g1_i3:71-1462(+)
MNEEIGLSSVVYRVVDDIFTQLGRREAELKDEKSPETVSFSKIFQTIQEQDLSASLNIHLLDQCSNAYSQRYQLRVHQQRGAIHGGSCGYFALHNALRVLQALRQPNVATAIESLRHICSPALYWMDYFSFKNLLLEQTKVMEQGTGLWDKEMIESMEMLRPHLDHLLEHHPAILELGGSMSFTALPSLSLREMQAGVMTSEDVCQINQALTVIHTGPHPNHAFLIGIGDHWTGVVVHKTANDLLEIVYLDSHNEPILSGDMDALARLADDVVERSRDKILNFIRKKFPELDETACRGLMETGHPYPRRIYSLKEQSRDNVKRWVDARHALDVLESCLVGGNTMQSIYLDALVSQILRSFRVNTGVPGPLELTKQVSFIGINGWLEEMERLHPSEIREGLLQQLKFFGAQALSQNAKTELLNWIGQLKNEQISLSVLCNARLASMLCQIMQLLQEVETIISTG